MGARAKQMVARLQGCEVCSVKPCSATCIVIQCTMAKKRHSELPWFLQCMTCPPPPSLMYLDGG